VRTVETASSTVPGLRAVWWVRSENSIILDAAIRVGVVAARLAAREKLQSKRMSFGGISGPIHPEATRRSGYRYQFYEKHHGRGGLDAAQWLPTLSHEEEFTVFDTADFNEFSDERGWFYGIRLRNESRDIPDLGTWGQQIAEFPYARPNEVWHGYPVWPLVQAGPENRRGEKRRPSKGVFQRMVDVAMLTLRERTRLYKEDHV
jgi:hypothetical protein